MVPWSLRDVKKQRWNQAQAHEAGFWVKQNAVPYQENRVDTRYAKVLQEINQRGFSGESILEVGSGPTCATRAMTNVSRVFADPLATVHSPLSPQPPNGHFVTCIGEELPFADGSFDGVFSFNVIDHVISPSHFVSELSRVARPGSLVVLGVYTHPRAFAFVRTLLERTAPVFRERAHPFFFSRESLVRLMRHHELQIEQVVCVYATKTHSALHRQDWVAIARK